MAGKSSLISLLALLSETCSKKFHKTNESSNRIYQTFQCSFDYLSGRHLSRRKVIKRSNDVKGHTDIYFTKFEVFSKLSKVCLESFLIKFNSWE